MNSKLRHLVLVGALLAIGLGAALLGPGNKASAAGPDLFLGKKTGATTVYFINDWFCPVCVRTEPVIEKLYPAIACDFSAALTPWFFTTIDPPGTALC